MEIGNWAEENVSKGIEEMKAGSFPDDSACWCPSCEADVAALSLRFLRPGYYTSCASVAGPDSPADGMIGQVIARSAERIARFPFKGHLGTAAAALRLVNVSREEGESVMDSLRERSELPCGCGTCRRDILAYALNRYPPVYCVERNGVSSLPPRERASIRDELASILTRSASVISRRPRH